MKEPSTKTSSSLELKRLEQATAKSATPRGNAGHQKAPALKADHEKSNPPIRFASAATAPAGASKSGGGGNTGKSRVRQKGHH